MESRSSGNSRNCGAFNCGSRRDDSAISFFSFPKQASRREEWCSRLKINLKDCNLSQRICQKHFKRSQFKNSSRNRLVENALPFIPSGSDQKQGLVEEKRTCDIVINTPKNVPAQSYVAPDEVNSVNKTIQASHIKRIATCTATSVSVQETVSKIQPAGLEPIQIEAFEAVTTQSGVQPPVIFPIQQPGSAKTLQIRQSRLLSPPQFLQPKLLTTQQIRQPCFPSPHQHEGMQAPFEHLGLPQLQQVQPGLRTPHQVQQTGFLIPQQIQQPTFFMQEPIGKPTLLNSKPIQQSVLLGTQQIKQADVLTTQQLQQPGLLIPQQLQQPELLNPQTQQMQWVFAGMGINGIPCFAQVQVSQPFQLQPKSGVLGSTIPTTSHADNAHSPVLSSLSDLILETRSNIAEDETIIESDPNKRCLMCNGKSKSLSSVKEFNESYILIVKNVFEILNLTRLIEDDLNIDPNEVPFCIVCLRQVDDMIKVHDELVILQERFEILKSSVIHSFISSFCQRKGLEEEDELTKDFYQSTATCNKMVNLLGSRTRIRSAQVIVSNFPDIAEIKDKQNFVLQRNAHESYANQMDFETTDFELEDTEGFNPDFILPHSPDPLAIPIEDIGKVEICFKGKSGWHKEKWEALSKCPETKEGLEKVLPCQYRRIICPICKKKVTPLKMSNHLKNFHPERTDIAEIEFKLSESTKIIAGMERIKIMKDKWQTLSNYTKKHNKNEARTYIPLKFRKVNCPICNKEVTANSIASHVNIHTGEKPFKCSKCPKAFARKSNLSGHRLVHLKKNPFQNHFYFCDLCSDGGKLCQLKSNYVRHVLNAHSTEVGVNDVLYFYNCDAKDCVHSFRQKDQFLQHIKTHGDIFLCQHKDCGKVFADSVNYESHCTIFHTAHTEKESGGQDGELFDCKYCPLISKDKNEWEIHELTHGIDMSTEQRTHLCDECGAGFKTYLLLWYHKRRTHKGSLQEPMEKIPKSKPKKCLSGVKLQNLKINYAFKTCQVCEKRFYSKRLTNHLLDVHTYENRLYCYICKQTFKSIAYLESHIRRHLGLPRKTSKEKCTFCSNEFPSILTLRKHCVQEHREQYLAEKPFYCPICWFRFQTEEEGKTHKCSLEEAREVKSNRMKYSSGVNQKRNTKAHLNCQICNQSINARSLTNHLLDIHTYENRLYCYLCKQNFKNITYLESHIRRHLGLPRKTSKEKCTTCNNEFPNVSTLRKHCVQEHSEQYLAEKPFYCPVCWFRFQTEEEGKTHHLKFHEQWRCKVCGKQLRNKFGYEHHVKIHTGETTYECKICQKRFIVLRNWKEHEMRHFGEKPLYCEFCNKGFFRKKLLRSHIANEHTFD